MKTTVTTYHSNRKLANSLWGELSSAALRHLKELTASHGLSVAAGDLQILDGRWYVTHAGLLRLAQRSRCSGMRTTLDKGLSDPSSGRWVFKATVYKSPRSRGFVGYGDADPSNVSSLVHGAEMRVAETRAVNRPSAKLTASASARLRNLAVLLDLTLLLHSNSLNLPRTETTANTMAMVNRASAIDSACSFASTTSMRAS